MKPLTSYILGIQGKALIFFLLLDLISFGALTYTVIRTATKELENQIRERLLVSSRDLLEDIDSDIMTIFASVQRLAAHSTIKTLLQSKPKQSESKQIDFNDYLNFDPSIYPSKVFLLDKNTKNVAQSGSLNSFELQDSPRKNQLLKGIFYTETYGKGNNAELLFGYPVMKDHNVIGALIVILNLNFVLQKTQRSGFNVALVTSSSSNILGEISQNLINKIAAFDLRPNQPISFEYEEQFHSVFLSEKVPGLDWVLITSIPKSVVLSPLKVVSKTMFKVGATSAFLFAIIVLWWIRLLVKPLINLRNSMADIISRGILDQRVEILTRDEIGDLAATFNHMVSEINIQRSKSISSAKMAALGEMSAGVAHEVNTPLTVIEMTTGQLEKAWSSENYDRNTIFKLLKRIKDTSNRISKIVKSMRSFSRDAAKDPFNSVTVKSLISETLDLCREKLENCGIALIFEQEEEGLAVNCRVTQLQQVILNLLNNSIDAIHDLSHKWIKIQSARSNGNIQIAISDCGTGIPLEIQEKIFTPFYTTKDLGHGTGLGLGIAQSIVKEHGGSLKLDTTCKNTRFVIDLPDFKIENITKSA